MTQPFIVCASVTLVSATVSLGFSVAAVCAEVARARVTALYTMARSLALMAASALAFPLAASPWLEAVACCMIVVQLCDAAIGFFIKDRMKTWGPAITAVLNLAALGWLLS